MTLPSRAHVILRLPEGDLADPRRKKPGDSTFPRIAQLFRGAVSSEIRGGMSIQKVRTVVSLFESGIFPPFGTKNAAAGVVHRRLPRTTVQGFDDRIRRDVIQIPSRRRDGPVPQLFGDDPNIDALGPQFGGVGMP